MTIAEILRFIRICRVFFAVFFYFPPIDLTDGRKAGRSMWRRGEAWTAERRVLVRLFFAAWGIVCCAHDA